MSGEAEIESMSSDHERQSEEEEAEPKGEPRSKVCL